MYLFDSSISFWLFSLAVYLIGMFAIGLPVGKYSLKAWKYPKRYVFWAKVLFPENADRGSVGRLINHELLPVTMSALDTHFAIEDEDKLGMAKYLIVQMIIWPLRLLHLTVVLVFTILLRTATRIPIYLASALVRCKVCLDM